jgi:Universal stress protein family
MNIQKILVPVDYSDHSCQALQWGASLAAKYGARLLLLHVMPTAVEEVYPQGAQSMSPGPYDYEMPAPGVWIRHPCILAFEEDAQAELPGRADGYPSGPPTDPYGRHARRRFLKQSLCYPPQSTGVLVSGVVSSASRPGFPPVGHSARRRLPSRGSLGPRFPTFPGTRRRDDGHRVPRGLLRLALASRDLACSRGAWSP